MCLILFAWKVHPRHDLVLMANRDEFYDRPSLPAHFWPDHPGLLAGQDLTAGGTWMGVTRQGRFAALTNYRDLSNIDPKAPSRGDLTKDFLLSQEAPEDYLKKIQTENIPYNGFNLLVGDEKSLWYYNNINRSIQSIHPGLHGLSNALLNDPWPKVEKGKEQLHQILQQQQFTCADLLSGLLDTEKAADHKLPSTGVPLEWERMLSPIFIDSDNYGTRCSTVLLKSKDQIQLTEKTYPHLAQKEDQVEFIL